MKSKVRQDSGRDKRRAVFFMKQKEIWLCRTASTISVYCEKTNYYILYVYIDIYRLQ